MFGKHIRTIASLVVRAVDGGIGPGERLTADVATIREPDDANILGDVLSAVPES